METPEKKQYREQDLDVTPIREIAQDVLFEVSRVIVGNGEILQQLFIALLVNGHVLLEGVPGLGKTVMAKTFANTLGITFRRIQNTPHSNLRYIWYSTFSGPLRKNKNT